MADIQAILRRYEQGLADRASYESEWRSLTDYMALSRQLQLNGGHPGSAVTGKIFDSISITAPRKLSSYIGYSLTNPFSRWARVTLRQDRLMRIDAVQDWTDDCGLRQDRARTQSNFNNMAGECYLDGVVFGNLCLLIEGLPPRRSVRYAKMRNGDEVATGMQSFNGFRYSAVPIGTYVFWRNDRGVVDALTRSVQMSPRQILAQFGTLPDSLTTAMESKPDEMVEMLHAVYPRSDTERNPNRIDGLHMPFASVWIHKGSKGLVEESGHPEFPYAVSPWNLYTGETWGRGQGHEALPDIRLLNERVEIREWDWKLRLAPPTLEEQGAIVGALGWEAGYRNITRGRLDGTIKTLVTNPHTVVEPLDQENRVEQKIREVFFLNQIEALPDPVDGKIGGMSVFEVAKRLELVFKLLGPVHGNLHHDWLQPLATREFMLMYRGGAFEDLPEALLTEPDADLDFVFDSPMSRAQRAEEADAIERAFATTAQLAEMRQDPGVWDHVDVDEGQQQLYAIRGLPAKVLRGTDTVAAIRKAREEAQVAQMRQQDALAATEGIKNLAPMVKAVQQQPASQAA